mmetsp:Transcript_11198/g.24059  ORF Transcript_11198/g.24059 Transcript_11198/m.24059 type:complete len:217 (+) Transcript_11198:6-656(+)
MNAIKVIQAKTHLEFVCSCLLLPSQRELRSRARATALCEGERSGRRAVLHSMQQHTWVVIDFILQPFLKLIHRLRALAALLFKPHHPIPNLFHRLHKERHTKVHHAVSPRVLKCERWAEELVAREQHGRESLAQFVVQEIPGKKVDQFRIFACRCAFDRIAPQLVALRHFHRLLIFLVFAEQRRRDSAVLDRGRVLQLPRHAQLIKRREVLNRLSQ